MKLNDLIKLKDAPEKGNMLVYTRTGVDLMEYSSLASVAEHVGNKDILELHLFDSEREYRAVTTRSKRFVNGVIEHLAQCSPEKDLYTENVLLENNEVMQIHNFISYDDNGMATIDDYRLEMKDGGM